MRKEFYFAKKYDLKIKRIKKKQYLIYLRNEISLFLEKIN